MKLKNSQKGFTLFEMLIVLAFFAVIGTATTIIFLTSVRSSTQSRVMAEVRGKGNFVMGVIEKVIRESQEVLVCTSSQLSVTNRFGETVTFDCSATEISSNSAALVEDVAVTCGTFCSQGTGSNPEVIVNFTLSREGSSLLPYQQATISFEKTVVPRNQ